MAKKILTLEQGRDKLQERLNHPLWRVYDSKAKVYRFYADRTDSEKAEQELLVGSLSAELILKQEFEITAPAPYTVSVTNYTDGVAVLEGTQGTYLDYEFQTVDGNGTPLNEWVDVTYTFTNNGVVEQTADSWAGGTKVHKLVDQWLKPGTNIITVIATGRTSKQQSSPVVLTYKVVSIGITSTFDVAKAYDRNALGMVPMLLTYRTWGAYDKYVEFYIDSEIEQSATAFVSASNDMTQEGSVARNADILKALSVGKHTLQMRTRVNVNSSDFYTNTLYYEFVVTGAQQIQITIGMVLPPGTIVKGDNPLILNAEQFKAFVLQWGYYNSAANAHTATVTWRLAAMDGSIINISTQNATVVDATNNTAPDPLSKTFETYGEFLLQAVIADTVIAEYNINIVKNTDGIEKYVNGLRCELSADGRSNDEPSGIREIWTSADVLTAREYHTTFNAVAWNTVSGWLKNALVLREGATADVDIDTLQSPQDTGATVEVTFETFACADDEAPVLQCGLGKTGGSIAIYGKKAVMRSRLGAEIKTEFQTDRKITLAFVINASSKSGITSQGDLMFIQTNGIRERSESYSGESDTFNAQDTLHLGNPDGKCGIRIYSIRVYDRAVERNTAANNYILGTDRISTLIDQNDILTNGLIDIDKLTSKYDTIAITADISVYFNSTFKEEVYGRAWRKNPQNPKDNFEAIGVVITHPGQSTLGFSKPQLRLNFNSKKAVVLYNYEGNIVQNGRYPTRFGAIPEKKVRLNPNFVDSTCGNAGGFFNMVNDLYPNVQVGNDFVLRTAAQHYVLEEYARDMDGKQFPYEMQSCPRSYPCVVIWRATEQEQWSFLSIFNILDEKKSPYKLGQHSIYDKVLADGTPDPFDFYDGQKGERLWDNKDCLHYEIENNGEQVTLFKTLQGFWGSDGLINEQVFEREYPDADDLTPAEVRACDERFYRLAEFLYSCRDDQAKFDTEYRQYMDPYKFAAYYVLMMKLGMVDSSVRNMNLRSDDGIIWYPVWWDPDVQKGKRNDGPLVFSPRIDRKSRDPENPANFAFAGPDSVLWNRLEGCHEWMNTIVPAVNQGLYSAGLNVKNMMAYYGRFTSYFCIRLYNESIEEKYHSDFPAKDYLDYNMGSGENHDLWWVADSFKYWDARWCSGSYATSIVYTRVPGAYGKYSTKGQQQGHGCRIYCRTAEEQYFMWAQTDLTYRQLDEPIHAMPTVDDGRFVIELGAIADRTQDFGYNNPIVLYGTQSLSEIDYHELAPYFSSTIQLEGLSDPDLGSNLKRLILGVSKEDMARTDQLAVEWDDEGQPTKWQEMPVRNYAKVSFSGLSDLTLLEYLDVQGFQGLTAFTTGSFDKLENIKTLLAAGSGLVSFAPHAGINFSLVELPDALRTITLTDCTWQTLRFFSSDDKGVHQLPTVPATLEAVYFYNMGQDLAVRRFVFDWLNAIGQTAERDFTYRHLTLTNVLWEDITYDQLMLLARIPAAQRTITGSIQLGQQLTSLQFDEIKAAFGDNCFTNGAALTISAEESFLIGGASNVTAGTEAQIVGISFPVANEQPRVEYYFKGISVDPFYLDGERVYRYRNITLYADTGRIVTVEDATPTHTVTVRGENMKSGGFADMDVTVHARTYPESAVITGDTLITSMGGFPYTIAFAPDHTTGTLIREQWSLIGAPAYITIRGNGDRQALLEIIDKADGEITFQIHYEAGFRNTSTVTARDLEVIYIAVMEVMKAANSLSEEVILRALWQEFGRDYMESQNRLYNSEARNFNALPSSIVDDDRITEFTAIRYFKNLREVELHCPRLAGLLDCSGMTRLSLLDVTGTYASVIL